MPKIVAQKIDWLNLGFKLFSRKGQNGIVVEQMAQTLQCNKSSFYWHFKTKEAFIRELVDLWSYNDTQQIIDLANKADNRSERYHKFIGLVFQKDPFLDFVFYLKRYALRRPEIQATIDRIDFQRLQYIRDLLQDFGMDHKEAKIKSTMLYRYLIGFHEMYRYKEMESGYLKEVHRDIQIILQLEKVQ